LKTLPFLKTGLTYELISKIKTMLRQLFLCCCLFFHPLFSKAQLKGNTETSSLLKQLQNSRPDTNRIHLLYKLSDTYLSTYDGLKNFDVASTDSCILFLKQAVSLSDSLNLTVFKYESYVRLGRAYLAIENVNEGKAAFMVVIKYYQHVGSKRKEAETWRLVGVYTKRKKENLTDIQNSFRNALMLYQELNDKEREADVKLKIADTYLYEGKLNIGEKELLQVLEIYHSINFKTTYDSYYLLSVINRYKGDFDKSLLYARKCVQNMEDTKDTAMADFFYGELALVYDALGHVEESIQYYKKTLQKREEKKSAKTIIYRTAWFLSKQLIKQGKESEALSLLKEMVKRYPPLFAMEKAFVAQNMAFYYSITKQNTVAEKYYMEMLSEYENAGVEDESISTAYEAMADFYIEQKQYDKARHYLDKALDVPEGTNTLLREKDIQLKLFITDSASGNYFSAIKHFRQHKILNDSIFNEKKSQQIEELQIQYQTVEKEKEIIQLNNQSRAQKSELVKSALFGNIIIACVLLLAGFIFYRYKLKQRSNKKLEAQQKIINQKNISLQRLVKEKEWLVKEIHHRVKNNLHTIIGLLHTQSGFLKTEEALLAINDSQHRIQTMSLIHEKLFQSGDLSTIEMSVYIHELVDYLKHSFDTGERILFKLDTEALKLKLSHSLPLGLILNEAITNAIKYAFPANRSGIISVSLKHTAGTQYMLTIADNGKGLPESFDFKKSSSMGMNLMEGLSEDINGHFSINNNNGTEITILFLYESAIASEPVIQKDDRSTVIV
jgi:two-component sensor histidine kinase